MVRGKSQISPPANYETYFSCSLSVGLFLLLFLPFHIEIWHLNIYLRQLVTFYSLYQATCNGFGLGVWGFSVYGALPLKFQSLGENFCRLEHFHIHKLWHNFDSFPCPCRVMLECLDLFPHFSLAGRCSSWLEFPGVALGLENEAKWGRLLWAHSFINASGGSLFLVVCRFALTDCCLSLCLSLGFSQFFPPTVAPFCRRPFPACLLSLALGAGINAVVNVFLNVIRLLRN